MRNLIIMVLALALGTSAANANHCDKAKKFLEKDKVAIEALLNQKATDSNHLNVMQDMAKIKLGLLEKIADLNISFLCKKLIKKVEKLVSVVAIHRALMPASESAVPATAPTDTESAEPAKAETPAAAGEPAKTETPTATAEPAKAAEQPAAQPEAPPTADASKALVIEQGPQVTTPIVPPSKYEEPKQSEEPTAPEEGKAPAKPDSEKPSDTPTAEQPASPTEPAK